MMRRWGATFWGSVGQKVCFGPFRSTKKKQREASALNELCSYESTLQGCAVRQKLSVGDEYVFHCMSMSWTRMGFSLNIAKAQRVRWGQKQNKAQKNMPRMARLFVNCKELSWEAPNVVAGHISPQEMPTEKSPRVNVYGTIPVAPCPSTSIT